MKKGITLMLAVAGLSALILTGCGEKFTPLTDEQINAKVDSTFEANKEAKLQELRSACQSRAETEATAKFEELKNAAVAAK